MPDVLFQREAFQPGFDDGFGLGIEGGGGFVAEEEAGFGQQRTDEGLSAVSGPRKGFPRRRRGPRPEAGNRPEGLGAGHRPAIACPVRL